MKYYKDEQSGRGKTRYCFALGSEEAELLLSLVNLSQKHTPDLPITEQIRNRLKNMSREIKKALGDKEFIELNNKDLFDNTNNKN